MTEHPPDPVSEADTEPGLAHTSGSDQRHEPRRAQHAPALGELLPSPDEGGQLDREPLAHHVAEPLRSVTQPATCSRECTPSFSITLAT